MSQSDNFKQVEEVALSTIERAVAGQKALITVLLAYVSTPPEPEVMRAIATIRRLGEIRDGSAGQNPKVEEGQTEDSGHTEVQ